MPLPVVDTEWDALSHANRFALAKLLHDMWQADRANRSEYARVSATYLGRRIASGAATPGESLVKRPVTNGGAEVNAVFAFAEATVGVGAACQPPLGGAGLVL